MKLKTTGLGMALGLSYAVIYLVYIIFIMSVSRATALSLLSSIMPGFNVGAVVDTQIKMMHALVGIVGVFVIGYVFGFLIAYFYNMMNEK